ncbi:MAG: neutral/alkaline non-lysosomal ceramidase N-terminal domain-containing protein [Planctomycetota bacterium]|nr:neutral/alkaline non-lysosomal ceramidase N-terminal domain-containing protein [Planctomycetota bacterium]
MWLGVAGSFFLWCVLGCATIRGTILPPEDPPAAALGSFRVGAAKQDITPMPGFPMGGHSTSGAVSRGIWNRLYARAIYLDDDKGNAIVLVSCDLWSVSAGLCDRVAELIRGFPETAHIGRAQIVLAATHTHHSPGNFSSSAAYNLLAQPLPGFDKRLFEFLSRRIAKAILGACKNAEKAVVSLHETVLKDIVRNRSFEAFLLNPESESILKTNRSLPDTGPLPDGYPEKDVYRGVDPRLRVLKVVSQADPGRTIAIAGFLAVHPTSLRNSTEVYNADLFGVAATMREEAIRAGPGDKPSPVVALFNGALGDISPAWERQDLLDAMKLGGRLAQALQDAEASPAIWSGLLADSPEIQWRYDRVHMRDKTFRDKSGRKRKTTRDPRPGAPMLGGAPDGRTPLYGQGKREKVRGRRLDRHGSKEGAFDRGILPFDVPLEITDALIDPAWAPTKVPVSVIKIGELYLATVPGEFTTVMGRRTVERIREELRDKGLAPAPLLSSGRADWPPILLIGMAHEYLSYYTTPEEYELQFYEGGSTLYGPHAGAYIGHHLARLAGGIDQKPERVYGDFSYNAGPKGEFGFKGVGRRPFRPDGGLDNILIDRRSRRPNRGYPWFSWRDAHPEFPDADEADARVTPRVWVDVWESRRGGGGEWKPLESEADLNIVIVAIRSGTSHSHWATYWMPPEKIQEDDRVPLISARFRFRVLLLDGRTEVVSEFRLGNDFAARGYSVAPAPEWSVPP